MKSILFIAFLCLASFALAEITKDEGVLVLTENNWDEAIAANQFLLVEFYAPWCGHCKKLAPEFIKAAAILEKEDPPLYIAKVDCTVEKELGTKWGVSGYPTLKFFVNGVPQEYQGGRTEPEIVAWLRKKTGPPSKIFNDHAAVESWNSSLDASVVFFGTNESLFNVFQNVARSTEDVSFASCSSEDCLTHFNARHGQVTVFKKFDDLRNDLTESFTEESLTTFISSNSTPKVMKFDEKCAQLIFGKATPGIFFYRDPNASDAAKWQEMATALSERLGGKLKVIVTGITDGLEQRLAEYIGVKTEDLPSVRIHDTRTDLKKYTLSGEVTTESIDKFVSDWESGKLEPSLKSDEIPATNDEPVKILVGKNFHSIVMDTTKDVLVEFYAPWCGHCKKLSPIYDELALKLKTSNPNIVIAKMDSTTNEVAEVSVQGFPTLKFWPKGNKSAPMDYSGERDFNGFMAFLEKNASGFVKEEL